MKIKEVNQCLELLRSDLGDSLLASAIVGINDGQAIAAYNCDGKMSAIVAQLTSFLENVLKNTSVGRINKYYFLQLDTNHSGVVMVFDSYVWHFAFDSSKTSMGMVLNVFLPDLMDKFEAACM